MGQVYTLSEEGRRLIKKYRTRSIVCKIVSYIAIFIIALIGFKILDDMLPMILQILVIWLICFVVLMAAMVFLSQSLLRYGDILTVEGNPKLFLEVEHGLLRTDIWRKTDKTTVKGNKARRIYQSMINVSAAYCYMGEYQMALDCLKEYINVEELNDFNRLIYYNNLFVCYDGLQDLNSMRMVYEKFKQTMTVVQSKHYSQRIMVRADKLYRSCYHGIMQYEIHTLKGRQYAVELLEEMKQELDKETLLVRRISCLSNAALYHSILRQYDEAVDALETIVCEGKQLYAVTEAKKQLSMIRNRDTAIELMQEEDYKAVVSVIEQAGGLSPEEDIRDNVIYVLHAEDGNVAGLARITNTMKFGELVMNPQYDTDKNQFRLLEEMKRRDYISPKEEDI